MGITPLFKQPKNIEINSILLLMLIYTLSFFLIPNSNNARLVFSLKLNKVS